MPLPTRQLLLVLFVCALAAAWWRAPEPIATEFSTPPDAYPSRLPAQFSSEMLPQKAGAASHPNLTELPDGRIAAAWQCAGDN